MSDTTLRVLLTGDAAGAVRSFDEAAVAADESSMKMGDSMEKATGKVGGLFQNLGAKMQAAGLPFGEAVAGIGDKFSEAETKGQKFGAAMSTLGGVTLAAGAAGLAAAGAEGIHLAMSFDTATSKIAAAAGISQKAAHDIGESFLSTAGSTTYSGTQIAQAYAGVAAQLGATQGHALSTAQALGVMKAANDLAEGSGTQLATATKALAATMQAYGLKAKDATATSNTLYMASKMTGTGVTTLAQAMQRMHSQLGAVTPPLSQTSALMVDLAKHGLTGRQSISAVSTSMQTLLKAATTATSAQQMANAALQQLPPSLQSMAQGYLQGTLSVTQLTKATRKLTPTNAALMKQFMTAATQVTKSTAKYKELGLEVVNAQGKFVGMGSIITQLHQKIAGMSQAQQLAYLTTVFGATGARKMLDVIDAGPSAFDKATAAVTRQDAAHKAAEAATNNLKDQMEKLKVVAEDLGTRFGEVLIPKIEMLAHAVLDVIKWFEKHKDVALALAAVIGGVLSVAVATFAVNKIGQMVKSVGGAVDTLGRFGSKIGTLVSKLPGLGSSTDAMAASVEADTTAAGASMDAMAAQAETDGAAVGASFDGMATAAETAAPEVEAAGTMMGEGVSAAMGPIGIAIMAAITIVTLLATHWKEVSKILLDVWDGIKAAAEAVWHALLAFFKMIWGAIKTVFFDATLIGIVASHWSQIEKDAVRIWDNIVNFIKGIPSKIIAVFRDAGSWLLDVGKRLLDGLIHGIEHGVGAVINGVKKVGSDIVGAFKSVLSIFSPSLVFHNLGVNLMEGLAQGIEAHSSRATASMQTVAKSMATVPFVPPTVSPLSATGGSAGVLGATVPGVGAPAAPAVAGTTAPVVNVFAQTNASAQEIGSEVGWKLRTFR